MKQSTIKIRVEEKDGQIWLRALIRHPMETGLRKDKFTGINIPAHYINSVLVEANGVPVFSADWSGSISRNSFLFIKFDGATGDMAKLTWHDNMGRSDCIKRTVGETER